MRNRIRSFALAAAAGALLVAPAVGQAHHDPDHNRGGGPGSGGHGPRDNARNCVVKKGFVVKGTLVKYTPDTASTEANEQSVTLTVTKMNRHARRAGLTDADPATNGTQYTVNAGGTDGDPFKVRLSGYDTGETPAAGDKVRVVGKVAVTKRRCEPNASVEERYGAVNVRKVKIIDADD